MLVCVVVDVDLFIDQEVDNDKSQAGDEYAYSIPCPYTTLVHQG